MGTIWRVSCMCIVLLVAANCLPANPTARADATTYYVNNQAGSNCSDSNDGMSQAVPWCDFSLVNSHMFGPGDSILLARGATWDQQMTLNGSGSASAWITVDAYGSGPAPKIIRNGNPADRGVRMNNPSYWTVSNLEVGAAGAGILVYYDSLSHQGLRFSHIDVHDIHGIYFGNTADSRQDSIFDSAGIEFTANVTMTVAQHVVQDIELAYIEGTHNQDSIAFDWDNAHGLHVPYDTYPPYAAQNVTLRNLFLHDDDGGGVDAGRVCPDSLRLS